MNIHQITFTPTGGTRRVCEYITIMQQAVAQLENDNVQQPVAPINEDVRGRPVGGVTDIQYKTYK